MGPFAKLPMQCRHGVVSMRHTVNGTLTMYGKIYIFKNGIGYAERRGVVFVYRRSASISGNLTFIPDGDVYKRQQLGLPVPRVAV